MLVGTPVGVRVGVLVGVRVAVGVLVDADGVFVDVGPDGTMSLAVGDTKSSLGPKLTDNLWVRPAIRKARAK